MILLKFLDLTYNQKQAIASFCRDHSTLEDESFGQRFDEYFGCKHKYLGEATDKWCLEFADDEAYVFFILRWA